MCTHPHIVSTNSLTLQISTDFNSTHLLMHYTYVNALFIFLFIVALCSYNACEAITLGAMHNALWAFRFVSHLKNWPSVSSGSCDGMTHGYIYSPTWINSTSILSKKTSKRKKW